jgi:ABC-type amino acid transport substrate-binding protein
MRIGYLQDFAPFCRRTGRGAEGRLVAALRSPGVRFIPAGLEALPAMLAGKEIDAILPKAQTGARAGQFDFSAPLARTGAALFGLAGRAVPHPGQAGRCRIATPGIGPLAALLPSVSPDATVLAVADYAAAFAAVVEGRADYAALNADAGAVMAGARFAAGPRFAELDLCLAARPGDGARVFARLGLVPAAAG